VRRAIFTLLFALLSSNPGSSVYLVGRFFFRGHSDYLIYVHHTLNRLPTSAPKNNHYPPPESLESPAALQVDSITDIPKRLEKIRRGPMVFRP
jgi:hypothetical protein